MPRRQRGDRARVSTEHRIGQDQERLGSSLDETFKASIQVARLGYVRRQQSKPQRVRRALGIRPIEPEDMRRIGIVEHRDARRAGNHLLEQLESLFDELGRVVGQAGNVTARPSEGADETRRDRVTTRDHHDGDGPRRVVGRVRGDVSERSNDVHLLCDELRGGFRQSLVIALGATAHDLDRLSPRVSKTAQRLSEDRPGIGARFPRQETAEGPFPPAALRRRPARE